MKRHKYTLPKYVKKLTKFRELRVLALKYIREQAVLPNNSILFYARRKLRRLHPHASKITTYCLVTGRVRYTIKDAQVSRQLFYEYCSEGFLPGYFFSS
jgi:ribosomal protein S14